jgi:NADP-dependent 3-hydroxy acid dehydrogenase YdfG
VKGKNVVVTGGGAGIGRAFAEAFAKANAANIFLTGRRANKLEETAKKVNASSIKTIRVYPY